MEVSAFFFYLFSAMIIVFGILAVTTKKIFHAAVYLLFTLMNVAALYFYLNYEFLAAVQIVVYVGGIVVLILFSLFLTHRVSDNMSAPPWYRIIFSVLLSLFGFLFAFYLILWNHFPEISNSPVELSVKYIGRELLNYGNGGFVLPFEVVSILLLAALIGSISIAFKTKKDV